MVNYGSVLAKLKHKSEALEYYKKALSIYIQVFGNEHEKTTRLLEKIEKL